MTPDYQTRVQDYITQNKPNATVGDVIGKKEIIKHEFPYLMGTLPYKTVQVSSEFAQVADNLRYKVTFEIQDSNANAPSLSYTTGISELAGKRVTLSYSPATANDEQIINSYDGIFNVPAYLVNMKPQIKIDGVVAAIGNPVGLGNDQTFNMQFVSPAYGTESVSNVVTVGAYYGIGINPSRISGDLLVQRKTKLEPIVDTACVPNQFSDDCSGELLYVTALTYFFVLNGFEDMASQSHGIIKIKDVSESIVAAQVNVSHLFDIPRSLADAGMMIDVDRNIYIALSKNGDQNNVRQFMITSGQMSSAMEHGIFELMFQAKGISTVQVLQLANSQGIPIYTITQNNISSVLPMLQIANEVKADIQNAVNAGKNVIIPQQNITYYTWSGTGYIVMDDQTGAGAYMISTSLAGGGCCIAAGGLTTILLTIISATGSGGHTCTIFNIEHNQVITALQFLVPIMIAGTFGSLALWAAFTGVGGVAGAVVFGILGSIGIAIAIFFLIVLVKAFIDMYYSNSQHAHDYKNERTTKEKRYVC